MKKSIIAIVLAVATLVTFIIPASAWSWKTDGKYEVTSHKAALVTETGHFTIDAEMEDEYRDGTKIESYPDEEPYRRGQWAEYQDILDVTRGEFFAYIAVDPAGMYIYAEIEDETIFDTDRDGNANEGDMLQIYLDWCEPDPDPMYDMMHPSATAMYNLYLMEGEHWEGDTSINYRGMYGASGMMYLGWIAGDYHETITTAWGFSPYQYLGLYADKAIEYAADTTSSGWKCEWFIPWREESQGERIAKGEQFHCGIGFQAADDSDLYDVVDYQENGKSMLEKSVGITFDQRKEIGLGYYINYASLADVMWADSYPDGYLKEDSKGGQEIDTSDSVIAIVAALGIAGAGVVLFSTKKKED